MRTFLAAEVTPELQGRLAATQQSLKEVIEGATGSRSRVTWVRPHVLHLTLKFLGEFAESDVKPLREKLGSALREHPPLAIPLTRLGVFPRRQMPRAIWVGPPGEWHEQQDAHALAALVATVDEVCGTFGAPRDQQPFRPHLTLARIRGGERAAGRAMIESGILDRELTLGQIDIGTIALMKSDLQPAGPVHTVLWAVTL